MGAAKANELHNIAVATAATIPIRFFMPVSYTHLSSGSEVPSVLRWGAGKAGLGGALTAKIMGGAIRSNIESMGRQFIIGQNVKEAMGGLAKLRKDGCAFTVDLLGEASVNEEESDAYAAGYHEDGYKRQRLIVGLAAESPQEAGV